MAGGLGGSVRIVDRLCDGSPANMGCFENSNSPSRFAVHRALRCDVGLATLSVGCTAGDDLGVSCQLRAGAPRRKACSSDDLTRLKPMTSNICLSCRESERYLGEHESRVHSRRG